MWRVLAVGLAVIGCGDPAPATTDAAADAETDAFVIRRTSPFVMQLCTSGNPGDVTCPLNSVALDELGGPAVGARLTFTAKPMGQDMVLDDIEIAGVAHLHIAGLQFEQWTSGTPTRVGVYIESLDAGSSVGPVTIEMFGASSQVGIRVEAID
ncbi:MAG TPA: hypothetical protein VMZ53_05110 [Kofleriaceae bacterium]|nr:hypothetical protein [Kofleriaceae bacterium]